MFDSSSNMGVFCMSRTLAKCPQANNTELNGFSQTLYGKIEDGCRRFFESKTFHLVKYSHTVSDHNTISNIFNLNF